ncbi:hypothetical protein BDN72DRAFT_96280 [Pluteus cervinus]|uniref:Uncharacterized protein n=1 Tax=Pluteus cervinus TaxID=181527 RepID=A0ACD3AQA0_9AGAR|nr:hypothetical protein BDN72DRAFT_96280 [Pluteus cervinus]
MQNHLATKTAAPRTPAHPNPITHTNPFSFFSSGISPFRPWLLPSTPNCNRPNITRHLHANANGGTHCPRCCLITSRHLIHDASAGSHNNSLKARTRLQQTAVNWFQNYIISCSSRLLDTSAVIKSYSKLEFLLRKNPLSRARYRWRLLCQGTGQFEGCLNGFKSRTTNSTFT